MTGQAAPACTYTLLERLQTQSPYERQCFEDGVCLEALMQHKLRAIQHCAIEYNIAVNMWARKCGYLSIKREFPMHQSDRVASGGTCRVWRTCPRFGRFSGETRGNRRGALRRCCVKGNCYVKPVKEFGQPVMDAMGLLPYSALNSMLDAGFPQGCPQLLEVQLPV